MATSQGSPQRDGPAPVSSAEVIQQQILQRGFADVMVVLTTTIPASIGKARAAGAGGADTLGTASKFETLFSSPTSALPGDLLGCFESMYHESVSESGVSLALRPAPRREQPQISPAEQVAPVQYLENLGIVIGSIGTTGLSGLLRHALVKNVIPIKDLSLVHPMRIASATPKEGTAWGLSRMGIPFLWEQGLDGTGIKIGHLDTGADGTHPMLQDAFEAFWESNYIGRPVECPEPHDTDIHGHGTHTAGTLVGREVNGCRMGVAPGAKLASGIVIEGGRVTFRILGGLNWVLGQDIRVLNMSLGIPGVVEDFLEITKMLRDRRVLLVVAIGNEGPGTSRSPGNYTTGISVGAMDANDQVASFSSSDMVGDRIVPDLVAPGVEIVSCIPGNKYVAMDGTSMAAPHVAGLAALLFQAKPDATVDQIQEAIYSSCHLPEAMTRESGNRGVPDGRLALEHLLAQ
jgi:subtilisin